MCLSVPRRAQLGDVGCGLYSLGMVMDYWHGQFSAANPSCGSKAKPPIVALVKPMDAKIGAQVGVAQFSVPPTDGAPLILDVAQKRGLTRYGETYAAEHLCILARHFGYEATLHREASLATLLSLLESGVPAIVAVDIDLTTFQPATATTGQHTHFVVVEGFFGFGEENLTHASGGVAVEPRRCQGEETQLPTEVSGVGAWPRPLNEAVSGPPVAIGTEELVSAVNAAENKSSHKLPGDCNAKSQMPQFLLVKQSGRRAPIPTVWRLSTFLDSWCGQRWGGRHRRRTIPAQVACRLELVEDGLRMTPADGEALHHCAAEKVWVEATARGFLERTADGLRLSDGALLHHEQELRQCIVEIHPGSSLLKEF
eukprot:SAG31_NODE_3422_length_4294_cov_2.229028_2_plen_369_part_00